jgi:hypothetical protein
MRPVDRLYRSYMKCMQATPAPGGATGMSAKSAIPLISCKLCDDGGDVLFGPFIWSKHEGALQISG